MYMGMCITSGVFKKNIASIKNMNLLEERKIQQGEHVEQIHTLAILGLQLLSLAKFQGV